jgi:hypothetical protein
MKNSLRPLWRKADREVAAFLICLFAFTEALKPYAFGKCDILCLAARPRARNMPCASWAEASRITRPHKDTRDGG